MSQKSTVAKFAPAKGLLALNGTVWAGPGVAVVEVGGYRANSLGCAFMLCLRIFGGLLFRA